MAWYGPSGECGCCGEAAQCLCDADCECSNLTLHSGHDGDSLTGYKYTLSGFPAVIELKVAIPQFPLSGYIDEYCFVSGLNQFNGTYDMVNATFGGVVSKCFFQFTKEITVFVQIFRSTTSADKCVGSLEEVFSGNVQLGLYIRSNGTWTICCPSSIFTRTPTCSLDGFCEFFPVPGYGFQTTLCNTVPMLAPACASDGSYTERMRLGIASTLAESYLTYPDLVCLNHSYFFDVTSSVEAIITPDTRKAIDGWTVNVSEIKDKLYVRSTYPLEEVYELSGMEQLNGTYFLPNVRSNCKPADYTEEVPITWKKYIISESSPCTIIETAETGTATGRFKYRRPGPSQVYNRWYLTTTFPTDLLGNEREIATVLTDTNCFENCGQYTKNFDECTPDYNQVIFKVCTAPRLV